MLKAIVQIAVTWISTGWGGAETSSRELADGFRDLGHSAYLYECQLTEGLTDEEKKFRLKAHKSKLSNAKMDLLISNHRSYAFDWLLAQELNIPIVVIFRGILFSNKKIRVFASEASQKLEWRSGEELDWNVLKKCHLVGISKASAKSVNQYLGNEVTAKTILNPVKAPKGISGIHKKGSINRYVVIGRLVKWKNCDLGVRAFQDLTVQKLGKQLVFIGDGDERPHLEILAKECNGSVKFLGYNNDPYNLVREDDCLLHCAQDEGFGRVIVEAAQRRIPAIVPDSGAPGELVVDKHNGWHYSAGSLDSLITVLKRSAAEKTNRLSEMKEQAFQAGQKYTPRKIAKEYIDLVEDYIGS